MADLEAMRVFVEPFFESVPQSLLQVWLLATGADLSLVLLVTSIGAGIASLVRSVVVLVNLRQLCRAYRMSLAAGLRELFSPGSAEVPLRFHLLVVEAADYAAFGPLSLEQLAEIAKAVRYSSTVKVVTFGEANYKSLPADGLSEEFAKWPQHSELPSRIGRRSRTLMFRAQRAAISARA